MVEARKRPSLVGRLESRELAVGLEVEPLLKALQAAKKHAL